MERTERIETEEMSAWVGTDVSQQTLDVGWRQKGKAPGKRRVKKAAQGCRELLDWLGNDRKVETRQKQVCLEATGWYSDLASTFFYEQGFRVSVLNPAVLTNYREGKKLRSK